MIGGQILGWPLWEFWEAEMSWIISKMAADRWEVVDSVDHSGPCLQASEDGTRERMGGLRCGTHRHWE